NFSTDEDGSATEAFNDFQDESDYSGYSGLDSNPNVDSLADRGLYGGSDDNPDPRGETATNQSRADSRAIDSWAPNYNNHVSTKDLRTHLNARSYSITQTHTQCQGSCSMVEREQTQMHNYYSAVVDPKVTDPNMSGHRLSEFGQGLPGGPVEAHVTYNIGIKNQSQEDLNNVYALDDMFLNREVNIHTPLTGPVSDELSSNMHQLGQQVTVVAVMGRSTFHDVFTDIDEEDNVTGFADRLGPNLGGVVFATVPDDTLSDDYNTETMQTLAHETYHQAEMAIVDRARDMQQGRAPASQAVIDAARVATAVNDITLDPYANSAVPHLDLNVPTRMSKPGQRFGVNYSNTAIEMRATLSEDVISGSTKDHWGETLQKDYDLTAEEAERVMNEISENETLAESMETLEEGAAAMLGK
ncbi:MAG: hypothetical protein HRT45_19680, partial [Bdellovibrionales bacterium]|nr:hypothetical protein [Bdellovibrionales bacterium]